MDDRQDFNPISVQAIADNVGELAQANRSYVAPDNTVQLRCRADAND